MHEGNTLQTQPFELKQHNRSKTIAFEMQQKSQNQTISINDHFKAFLNSHSHQSSAKNSLIPKFNRINHSRTLKKSSISGELFDQQKDSKFTGEDWSYQNKLIEPAKCDKNEAQKQVLSDVLHAKQRKNLASRIQSRLQNLAFKAQLKKNFEGEGQIKSFGNFLEGMKRKMTKLQSYHQKSRMLIESVITESQLKVQGNQKELKTKNMRPISSRLKDTESSRAKSPSQNPRSINKTEKEVKQDKTIAVEASLNQKNVQSTKIGKRANQKYAQPIKKQPLKSINRVSGCLKNVYSPFNGIQIRYLSSENQNIAQKSYSSVDQKHRTLHVNSVRKPVSKAPEKKRALSIEMQKGIIFRSKEPKIKQIPHTIEGWKVQVANDQSLDLCIQF